MKNLFKNLMLVAVAAMAFTACEKGNDETNKTEQTRVVNFTATIGEDDTRSGFTEKVGDAYKSAWDGGEWILVRANNSGASIPSISKEGKLSVQFYVNDYEADFYSPNDSWDFNTYQPKASVLAEQTPRANSVDPKVHLLKKENLNIEGDNIVFAMEHAIAYGKMTVNAGFEVSRVKLTLNGTEHTINGTEVENNVFWFATNEANINEFTVLAYDANGNAVTRTVSNLPAEGEGSLKFQTGRVSTFSVSNMEEYVPPVAPAFTSAEATSAGSDPQDKYVYFYDANNVLSTLKVNPYYVFSEDSNNVWNEGTFTEEWSDAGMIAGGGTYSLYNGVTVSKIRVTVSHVEEGYHLIFEDIKDANGNMLLERATYTGTITGLSAPWVTGGSEGGGEPENPVEGNTVNYALQSVEQPDTWGDFCVKSTVFADGYYKDILKLSVYSLAGATHSTATYSSDSGHFDLVNTYFYFPEYNNKQASSVDNLSKITADITANEGTVTAATIKIVIGDTTYVFTL